MRDLFSSIGRTSSLGQIIEELRQTAQAFDSIQGMHIADEMRQHASELEKHGQVGDHQAIQEILDVYDFREPGAA